MLVSNNASGAASTDSHLDRNLPLIVHSRMKTEKWKDSKSAVYGGTNNDYQLRAPHVTAPGPTRPGTTHREQ